MSGNNGKPVWGNCDSWKTSAKHQTEWGSGQAGWGNRSEDWAKDGEKGGGKEDGGMWGNWKTGPKEDDANRRNMNPNTDAAIKPRDQRGWDENDLLRFTR